MSSRYCIEPCVVVRFLFLLFLFVSSRNPARPIFGVHLLNIKVINRFNRPSPCLQRRCHRVAVVCVSLNGTPGEGPPRRMSSGTSALASMRAPRALVEGVHARQETEVMVRDEELLVNERERLLLAGSQRWAASGASQAVCFEK